MLSPPSSLVSNPTNPLPKSDSKTVERLANTLVIFIALSFFDILCTCIPPAGDSCLRISRTDLLGLFLSCFSCNLVDRQGMFGHFRGRMMNF